MEDVNALLDQGYYLQALGVSPGAEGPRIIDATLDLIADYPDLQPKVVHARDQLLQHRQMHLACVRVRDRLLRDVRARWGPFIFDLLPRADVWRHIEDEASAQRDIQPAELRRRVLNWCQSSVAGVQDMDFPGWEIITSRTVALSVGRRNVEFLIPSGCRSQWLLKSQETIAGQCRFVRASFRRPTIGTALLTTIQGTIGCFALAVPIELAANALDKVGVEVQWLVMLVPLPFLLRYWFGTLFAFPSTERSAAFARWAGSTTLVYSLVLTLAATFGFQGWDLLLVSGGLAWFLLVVSPYILGIISRLFNPLVPAGAVIMLFPDRRETTGALLCAVLGLSLLVWFDREPASEGALPFPLDVLFVSIVAGLAVLWRTCLSAMYKARSANGNGDAAEQPATQTEHVDHSEAFLGFLATLFGHAALGTLVMAALAYYDYGLEPERLTIASVVWIGGYGALILLAVHWGFTRLVTLIAAAQSQPVNIAAAIAHIGAAAQSIVAVVFGAGLLLLYYDIDWHEVFAPGGMMIIALAIGRLWYELFIRMLRTDDEEERATVAFFSTIVGNVALAALITVPLAYACCEMRMSKGSTEDIYTLLLWAVSIVFVIKAATPSLAAAMVESMDIHPFHILQFLVGATEIPAAIGAIAWIASPTAWLPAFAIAWGVMTGYVYLGSWRHT